ncbi:IS630 family transposase [Terrimonas sp.]|uniref:IS630 family transposase n=1 Tax=Terrimonas sp. TaxID=1914338 RepID=UPI000D5098B4|nr:IS630 family transposase [Terrimonas sp.]PVD53864.1 IS630 family transposase [Terrimonas sp.]
MASLQWSVEQAAPIKPIVVFFEDEGRFGRISREMYCWVRKDMIPAVARQMVREYIYAFSAIAPQTGDCFSLIAPHCNTDTMNCFLTQLSVQYAGYRIVLLLDKAGWHISKNLLLPGNILLLHLPPYSPELNPVELLWRETRRKFFHNKIFNSLDQVEDTLATALAYYHQHTTAVKQLTNAYSYFSKIDAG